MFEGIVGGNELPEVIKWLQAGNDCIIEEISYCVPEFRNALLQAMREAVPDLAIEWVCLENDLELANFNVLHRDKGDVERHLIINTRNVSPRYTYPDGATPVPIHRITPKSC